MVSLSLPFGAIPLNKHRVFLCEGVLETIKMVLGRITCPLNPNLKVGENERLNVQTASLVSLQPLIAMRNFSASCVIRKQAGSTADQY